MSYKKAAVYAKNDDDMRNLHQREAGGINLAFNSVTHIWSMFY